MKFAGSDGFIGADLILRYRIILHLKKCINTKPLSNYKLRFYDKMNV